MGHLLHSICRTNSVASHSLSTSFECLRGVAQPWRPSNNTFRIARVVVAIVSQNCFVFLFVVYRTIIARYVAKQGIAQMCLCKTKDQGGGYRTILGELLNSLKRLARYGVSQ